MSITAFKSLVVLTILSILTAAGLYSYFVDLQTGLIFIISFLVGGFPGIVMLLSTE